ncbi:MAG: prepilin-type N-terminal cleavage/methylation domain-containing protein [Armatimonadetes bacterium]|nr:prepilin-type N-terminal cleavage/methylation domain-containing protein [Armatimonadota bacterium]
MSVRIRPGRPRPAGSGGDGRAPSSGAPAGFTLVELLVVIAVISVLAAILLPVFARAREKAHQVACLSNLRQLTLGILMYSQDNDDRCPPYSDNAGAYWPQSVAPYVQRQATADFNGASKVFVCPSAPYDAAQVTAFGNSALTSYGLTDDWVDQICPDDCSGTTGVPHAFGEAVAPAGTVLLAETMFRTTASCPATRSPRRPSTRATPASSTPTVTPLAVPPSARRGCWPTCPGATRGRRQPGAPIRPPRPASASPTPTGTSSRCRRRSCRPSGSGPCSRGRARPGAGRTRTAGAGAGTPESLAPRSHWHPGVLRRPGVLTTDLPSFRWPPANPEAGPRLGGAGREPPPPGFPTKSRKSAALDQELTISFSM